MSINYKAYLRPGLTILAVLAIFVSARLVRAVFPDIDNDEVRIEAQGGSFTMQEAKEIFPYAAELKRMKEDGFFLVLNEDGELLGKLVYGPPADKNIIGYAGRVPYLIGLDDQWRVIKVLMLNNQETISFSMRVRQELTDAWNNLTPEEAREENVDAISGATRTSQALIRGVEATLGQVVDKPYQPEPEDRLLNGQMAVHILVICFVIMGATVFLLPGSPSPTVRTALNVLSILIPGILAAEMLTISAFAHWLQSGFVWSIHWLPALTALLALLIPLLTGRNYYCFYYCPFGAAQELAGKLGIKKYNPRPLPRQVLTAIRSVLLATAAATVIFAPELDLTWIEPFSAFRWRAAPLASLILAAVFLVAAVRSPRLWCRLCPTGGIIDAMRRTRK